MSLVRGAGLLGLRVREGRHLTVPASRLDLLKGHAAAALAAATDAEHTHGHAGNGAGHVVVTGARTPAVHEALAGHALARAAVRNTTTETVSEATA
jgi:hypothetical protein